MCLARDGVGGEGGEWMRGLGLGFTNPVETGGVFDVCLCLSQNNGKSGVGGGGAGMFDTICTVVCDRCDSSTACRLSHLKPYIISHYH